MICPMVRRTFPMAVTVLVALSTLSACGEGNDQQRAVPAVTGLAVNDATKKLKEAGFDKTKEEDRKEKRAVFMDSNWVVFDQTPKAGDVASTDAEVVLGVIKKGESPLGAPPSSSVVPEQPTSTSVVRPPPPPPSSTTPSPSAPTTAAPTTASTAAPTTATTTAASST